MRPLVAFIFLSLTVSAPSNRCGASTESPLIEQPRSYGYMIGDLLSQRIAIDAGVKLDALPTTPADRVGQWLERRQPRLETRAGGGRWLVIEYQLINSPRELTSTTLPGLTIKAKTGPPLLVPPWPISVGPLTPPQVFGRGTLAAMQSDHAAGLTPVTPIRRRVTLGLSALVVVGTAWLLWLYWRNQQDSHRLPFARANRQLARLKALGSIDSAESWIVLHRAFNAAAGQAVQPESLGVLFMKVPGLTRLRAEIEAFYSQSSERFFSRTPEPTTLSLVELCRQLQRLEKSQGNANGV